MADTAPNIIRTEPEADQMKEQKKGAKRFLLFSWPLAWHQLALVGIVLISVFMDFYQLGANGYGSYYPPAVRSMMDNWHNFFFVSYDPGGFVTVDKPPVGFWFEVLSAKIFGFNSVSILLPQALAGVLSVLLLYYLVRRHFGIVAGLLAALALAVMPISVVTNRNITIDSILALFLLIGAWAVIRAAETGKLRWLLLSAIIVGIGFNIKMLEAYLIVPAFGLLYLLAAPRKVWVRIGHLALAGLVLLVVSFSWIAIVDLTPASQRPFVDSTTDNSELTLALGYNGIQRLTGNLFSGRGGSHFNASGPPTTRRTTGSTPTNGNGTVPTTGAPPTNGGNFPFGGTAGRQTQAGGGAGPGGIFVTESPGPLRLFEEDLGSQIGWLLPIALLGILALAWQRRPRWQKDLQQKSLLLWGVWLLTMVIFFSVAGFFHQYYMTEMAPAVAALFGIGLVIMWQNFRDGGWRGWLLPVALIVTLAEQIYLLRAYPTWSSWMLPLIIVLSVIGLIGLVAASTSRFPRLHLKAPDPRLLFVTLAVGLLALLLAPTVWAITPIFLNKEADTLLAGPPQTGGFGGGIGGFGGGTGNSATTNTNAKLISYLEANQGNAKFLVAVPSSQGIADQLIIEMNKPVMSLGGFSGSDPILTTSQLASLIQNGTVRYFLLNSSGGRQITPQQIEQILSQLPPQLRSRAQQALKNGSLSSFGNRSQSTLTTWVTQHCKTVPTNLWQSASTNSRARGNFGGASQLYDCAAANG